MADSYTEEDEDTEIEYQTRYEGESKGLADSYIEKDEDTEKEYQTRYAGKGGVKEGEGRKGSEREVLGRGRVY